MFIEKQKTANIAAILIIICFGISFYLKIDDPIRVFGGDGYDDSRAMISSDNFFKYSFNKLNFLPCRSVGILSNFYFHNGSLETYVYALIKKVGLQSIYYMRLVAIVCGLCGIYFLCKLISLIVKEQWIATLTIVLLLCCPLYYEFFDSLYERPFLDCLIYTPLYLFCSSVLRQKQSKCLFIFIWFLIFAQCLVSYVGVLYTQIFLWGFIFFLRPKEIPFNKIKLLWLFAAPCCATLLLLLRNAYALGFSAMIADLINAPLSETVKTSIPLTDKIKAVYYIFYPYQFIALLIALLSVPFVLKVIKKEQNYANCIKLAFLMFVCGITWFFIFTYSAVHHIQFNLRWIFPSIFLCAAGSIYYLFLTGSNIRRIAGFYILSIMILFGIISISQMNAQRLDGHFEKFRILDGILPQNSIYLQNFHHPAVQYYANRYEAGCDVRSEKKLSLFIQNLEHHPDLINQKKLYFILTANFATLEPTKYIKIGNLLFWFNNVGGLLFKESFLDKINDKFTSYERDIKNKICPQEFLDFLTQNYPLVHEIPETATKVFFINKLL